MNELDTTTIELESKAKLSFITNNNNICDAFDN
jgi:hypothetical protein